MGIKEIEDDIINQLQNNITDLIVENFPDNTSKYTLNHENGAILVGFSGVNYTEPDDLEDIKQIKTLEFILFLLIRGIRDKNGGYKYLDSMEETLTGYAPEGCRKMYPTDISFVHEDNGIWQYSMTFKTSMENYEI
jgi:hypothetical protein